jgi:hypothetical protein
VRQWGEMTNRLRKGEREVSLNSSPESKLGLLATLALSAAAVGQPRWIVQFGTASVDVSNTLAADGVGGVFIAGATTGDLANENEGLGDVYLARYSGSGDRLWMMQFGTERSEIARALAPDGDEGVFVGGGTDGDLAAPNAGNEDAFLARYDGTGHRIWIVQFGTAAHDEVSSLASDGEGGVFVGGRTNNWQAFLSRYNPDGERAWLVTFEHGTQLILALTPDTDGGVFTAGMTGVDLGGPNAGIEDCVLARYGSGGDREWLVQFGSEGSDWASALAHDGAGGIFVGGSTDGDLGGPNFGFEDAFLARYDSAGTALWLRQLGTAGLDRAAALAPDPFGGVFVAGRTTGSLGGGNAGMGDVFLARYDSAGVQRAITQLGTTGHDGPRAAATDGAMGVFVAGFTHGSLGGPHAGEDDVFLLRERADCVTDCDWSGSLDLFDFLCFVNLMNAASPEADCDENGELDLFDFLCFTNAFNAGC